MNCRSPQKGVRQFYVRSRSTIAFLLVVSEYIYIFALKMWDWSHALLLENVGLDQLSELILN